MKEMNVLGMYLNSVKDVVYLSASEEAELVSKGKNGDKAAREKVIKSALHYVISVCKSFKTSGYLTIEDFIGYGNLGLVKAFEAYKPEKGTRFITCAGFWIRKEIMDALGQCSRFIRLPQNCEEELSRIVSVMDELPENMGDYDKIKTVCRRLGKSEERVQELLTAGSFIRSLDEPCDGETEGYSLADKICDDKYGNPALDAEYNELADYLCEVVDSLPEDEAYVLTERYGLDNRGSRSLAQIGKEMGVSKETVRTLERRGLAHCRVYKNMVEYRCYEAA